MAKAGLKAIYLSGWQVAADANLGGQMYPDQSLYPANSVPSVVRSINNALMRADQIAHADGQDSIDWMLPIVADAEAGFGGVLNAFELMKAMIEAGAAAVHFEDQLSSAKKCGHMGGKVLVSDPGSDSEADRRAPRRRCAGRTDRPDRENRRECRPTHHQRLRSERRDRSSQVSGPSRDSLPSAVESMLPLPAASPMRPTPTCCGAKPRSPILREAKQFADAIHAQYPGKLLAYNCSPSFHWTAKLNQWEISQFQRELATMGYRFQFVTLAGFHALNLSAFELAHEYARSGMSAYSQLQQREFEFAERVGYGAVKHQKFVGTGYFDDVANTIAAGQTSIRALPGSTEEEQFEPTQSAIEVDSDCVIPVSGD